MIDELLKLFNTLTVLTVTKNDAKPQASATPRLAPKPSPQDLEFLSANQQLEGFPGKITPAVAAHRPNLDEIAESARHHGAQIPTEENRTRPPLFPRPKN